MFSILYCEYSGIPVVMAELNHFIICLSYTRPVTHTSSVFLINNLS